MDEDVETLVVRVRADTQGLSRDVEAMRASLEGPLASGAERAGLRIEQGLLRAVRTGKFGFEDLKRLALSTLDQIAASSLRSALVSGGSSGGGLVGLGANLLTSVLGLPGRATGGPVAPGRAYMVGERGPEVFVPTSAGHIEPNHALAGKPREVRVAINIATPQGTSAPVALQRSSRQVASALRRILF